MEEYISKSGLGSIVVYTAEEYKESEYAKDLGDVVLEGYVVLVLPTSKVHKTMKRDSYFFKIATSEEKALEHFKSKVEEKNEAWLKRLLKTIEFH